MNGYGYDMNGYGYDMNGYGYDMNGYGYDMNGYRRSSQVYTHRDTTGGVDILIPVYPLAPHTITTGRVQNRPSSR